MVRHLRCFTNSPRANGKLVQVFALLLTGLGLAYTAYGNPEPTKYDHAGFGGMKKSLTGEVSALTVSGTVRSDRGDALPGVSVVEKGTSNGTVTDTEGAYSFTVTSENATLVFSFIGYVNQEVALNGRSTADVTMVEDVVAL